MPHDLHGSCPDLPPVSARPRPLLTRRLPRDRAARSCSRGGHQVLAAHGSATAQPGAPSSSDHPLSGLAFDRITVAENKALAQAKHHLTQLLAGTMGEPSNR